MISGKVIDATSGQPVAGVTVKIASYSATSGADGSFSINLVQGAGTETGAIFVSLTGYVSYYVNGCSLDTTRDASITLLMPPQSSSTYPTHTITGHIYELQTSATTPTEIPSGSMIMFKLMNRGGGQHSTWVYPYAPTSGYVIQTAAFGSDCLLVAMVIPGALLSPFTVVVSGLDLSAASTPLTLTEDLAHTTTVTVHGDATINFGGLTLGSPYGYFTGAILSFTTGLTQSVRVTNPNGYSGIWSQNRTDSNVPITGYDKTYESSSPLAPVGTNVTLPALNLALGPTAIADPATLAYAGGTLSVAPAAGATTYYFSLEEVSTSVPVAYFISNSPTVSLPAGLQSQLAGRTLAASVTASVMNNISWDVSTIASALPNGFFPGSQTAIVSPTTPVTTNLTF